MNWRDLSYLQNGTERQKLAYASIKALHLMEMLNEYDPVLVSTIALDIDTPKSDLDVICCVKDVESFKKTVTMHFGQLDRFVFRRERSHSVCSFFFSDFEYEIYANVLPVEEQAAYKHLVQTARLIRIGGEKVRESVRSAKLQGVKTEPAIAQIFGLEGDPYMAVIDYATNVAEATMTRTADVATRLTQNTRFRSGASTSSRSTFATRYHGVPITGRIAANTLTPR